MTDTINQNLMWFNTGVRPENRPGVPLLKHQSWKGGVLQIAFYLETPAPANSALEFLCDDPEYIKSQGLIPVAVVGGGMLSKFAAFRVYGG